MVIIVKEHFPATPLSAFCLDQRTSFYGQLVWIERSSVDSTKGNLPMVVKTMECSNPRTILGYFHPRNIATPLHFLPPPLPPPPPPFPSSPFPLSHRTEWLSERAKELWMTDWNSMRIFWSHDMLTCWRVDVLSCGNVVRAPFLERIRTDSQALI